ncbi:hypothetical protein Hanom_Chr17g01553201 [Helianthus anomalus]
MQQSHHICSGIKLMNKIQIPFLIISNKLNKQSTNRYSKKHSYESIDQPFFVLNLVFIIIC